jgi:hypothetical protein
MEKNALVTTKTAALMASTSIFFDVEKFEHAQRIAKVFAGSTMVPEHFRNNIGNIMIAIEYAQRVDADIFQIMQSLYVVNGRPGIEGKLVISLINRSGRFDLLDYIEEGNLTKPEKETDGCYIVTKERKTGKTLTGPKVDWAMVKADGWYDKKGSKWRTIAPLMFRYRAAAFFARTYCPEVLLGMQTKEELEEIITLQPTPTGFYEAGGDDAEQKIDLSNRDTSLYSSKPASSKEQSPDAEPIPESNETSESETAPAGPSEQKQDPEPAPEPETQMVDWDPLQEPIMGRYAPEKADAVRAAADKLGVDYFKSWPPAKIHALVLKKVQSAEPQEAIPQAGVDDSESTPTPTPQSTPATLKEQFDEMLNISGLRPGELKRVDEWIEHHCQVTGNTPELCMKSALEFADDFARHLRHWIMEKDAAQDKAWIEAHSEAEALQQYNADRWAAIVRLKVQNGELPNNNLEAWNINQLKMVIEEWKTVDDANRKKKNGDDRQF